MKNKTKDIVLISLLWVALLAFVAIMIMVFADHTFFIDKFNTLVANHRNKFFNKFFKIITHIGSVYFIIALAVLFLAIIKDRSWGISALFNVSFAGLLAVILKYLVCRSRPTGLMLVSEVGFSFPSAHALLTTALLGLILYYTLTTIKNKPLKIVVSILIVFVGLLIGFSRVYLGVHYLSDVLAGAFLGVCVCVASIYFQNWVNLLLNKIKTKSLKENDK